MRLTVLVDNNTYIDDYFIGEPAVSFYLEVEDKKILFDAGYSDAFIRNAQSLGIDLTGIDMLVLSHGHLDHTWGLSHLVQLFTERQMEGKQAGKPRLIAHPDVFASRSIDSCAEIGSLLKEDVLNRFFRIKLSKDPLNLTPRLFYLGEIERLDDFEAQEPIGTVHRNGLDVPDMIIDDTALAYRTDRGLVIITGCSHSGICNIIKYACKVTGENRIVDIIGGFHLLNTPQKQMQKTKAFFEELAPGSVHACHCTDLKAKIELAQVANIQEVGAGLVLEY